MRLSNECGVQLLLVSNKIIASAKFGHCPVLKERREKKRKERKGKNR
jgi:hypothetical protein